MKNLLPLIGLVVCTTLPVGTVAAEGPVGAQNLIPKPVSVEYGTGTVTLASYPDVETADSELAPLARYLSESLPGGKVRLALDGSMSLPSEGYRLEVSERGVEIRGKDYGGVWNGIQTLMQMLPPEVYAGVKPAESVLLPVVTIEDWPRMAYRGVMLDVARTFVPKQQVLRLIDNLSRHKINRLHWHLADDEGWRIEIKGLPRLTSIGAFRGGFAGDDSPVKAVYGAWDERYGGYYTQDDIRQVVAYAALRNVEIIPEIDLPGHSRVAAIAYPEILCGNVPDLDVSAGYDIRNVWCAAREENYSTLEIIAGELAGLFPSEYIHLGGDEVDPSQWAKCPRCGALMRARGITDPARLEDLFISRLIDIAAAHGKKAGVWNEAAASGEIPKSTLVWGWENPAAARRMTAAGYPVILCPGEYFYFDMRQSPTDRGHIWAGIVSLEKVYGFDPAGLGFTSGEMAMVRGIEATFFSELLLENGLDYLDYQLFPRVCALAEVAWTPASQRSWSDFERRLDRGHLSRMAAMGIKYRVGPDPAPPGGLLTPAATFTGSIRENAKYPFSGVASYRAAARATRAPREGDWFQWSFAEPVAARTILVKTGYDHLQRSGFPQGRVEVSYDGKTFEKAADLVELKANVSLDADRPIRALRVVCTSHGNGENFTIIQPLKIR